MPMLNQALKTVLIDGKVYVDFEQVVQLIFDTSNETTLIATKTGDAPLGVMSLGANRIGMALDAVLTLQKEAAGLNAKPSPCSLSVVHPEHGWLKGRKSVRCPGVARRD